MGVRNLLILFFSAMAVSLTILIIFYSLFVKDIDLSFNAKTPEAAPSVDSLYSSQPGHPSVNVPPETRPPVSGILPGTPASSNTTPPPPTSQGGMDNPTDTPTDSTNLNPETGEPMTPPPPPTSRSAVKHASPPMASPTPANAPPLPPDPTE